MATESFELKFVDGKNINRSWLCKFSERIRIIIMKLKERHDLEEEEWEFLEPVYKFYQQGNLTMHASRLQGSDEMAVEQGLFNTQTFKNQNGKTFDTTPVNQNSKSNDKNKKI